MLMRLLLTNIHGSNKCRAIQIKTQILFKLIGPFFRDINCRFLKNSTDNSYIPYNYSLIDFSDPVVILFSVFKMNANGIQVYIQGLVSNISICFRSPNFVNLFINKTHMCVDICCVLYKKTALMYTLVY